MSTSETDPENGGDAHAHDDSGGETPSGGALSGPAGWLVVLVLFLSGIVAPALLYVAGQTGDLQALGLGFEHTYLAIPMIPAILLGAIGVWSALTDR